ncbi:MAG: PD40 domain-containing protein [Bryobacterales bacterium]|nr:PD40 domain-containing protein [Bryobacterales bacterium]
MSQTDPQDRAIRFGVFELNPELAELRKSGIRLKLAEQPFRILHHLVSRPGEIVTREELRNLLWGEDTFVDFDHGLNAAINKIREALGDSAATPRYIETVPRRGYRFIGQLARPAIPGPDANPSSAAPLPPGSTAGAIPRWNRYSVAAAVILLLTAAVGLWWGVVRLPKTNSQLAMHTLTADEGVTIEPVLSHDGKFVAYASDRATGKNLDIWVHPLTEGGQPIRLTTHEATDQSPDISPDGGQVVFRSARDGGGIYVVPTLGGEERLLVRGAIRPRFSPDGKSIAYCVGGNFMTPSRIYIIPVLGGKAKELATDVPWACWPAFSPDGRHILFSGSPATNDPSRDLWVTPVAGGPSIRTGASEILTEQWKLSTAKLGGYFGSVDSADGKILLSYDGRIWELDLSGPDWKATRPARPLTLGSLVTFARAGTGSQLVFQSSQLVYHLWKLKIDETTGKAAGKMERLPHSGGLQSNPSVSADGRWLAYSQYDPVQSAIRLRDFSTGKETTLLKTDARPKISPDGARVAYSVFPDSIYLMPAKGGEPAQLVAPGENRSTSVFGWTPDSKKIIYWYGSPGRFAFLDPDTRQSSVFLQHPKYSIYTAQISPDQHWVAFAMPHDGQSPLWITPLRDGKAAGESDWIRVSDALDTRPWWSRDGNLLYMGSRHDGFRCIWAQPLDPATKRPKGQAFAVQHVHGTRMGLDPENQNFGPAPFTDTLIFGVWEFTSNVWIGESQR